MNFLDAARDLDREDKPVEAARAYEAAYEAAATNLSLDDYMCAAVLYFTCTDFGYSSSKALPEEFARDAYAKAKSWLALALQRFDYHPEIRFWELYIDFVVLGTPPFIKECQELAMRAETLTPYFYLYASTKDPRYRAKAEQLYRNAAHGETAKERYIRSILSSLFKT
jgi:hypothetical protein